MSLPWYANPESEKPARVRRDPEEEAAILAALADLPPEHPARVAYADGVDTIALTHLVADRPATLEALKLAYLDGFARRIGSSFRP